MGPVGQAHELQGLPGLGFDVTFLLAHGREAQYAAEKTGSGKAVAPHHDVFQNRHVVEELHQLEGAGNAPVSHVVGRLSLDFFPAIEDKAGIRL